MVEKNDVKLTLWFTIDVGKYCWRNISKEYFLTSYGFSKLVDDFSDMGFVVFPKKDSPLFTNQFMHIRAKILVSRYVNKDVVKNVIIELSQPVEEPEHNVTLKKRDDHFFKNKTQKDLPIL